MKERGEKYVYGLFVDKTDLVADEKVTDDELQKYVNEINANYCLSSEELEYSTFKIFAQDLIKKSIQEKIINY